VLVSRRQVLASGVAGLTAIFGCATPSRTSSPASFKSVPLSRNDTLVVPEGYRADVLFA
jgi:secreted PhoX family phosphatase